MVEDGGKQVSSSVEDQNLCSFLCFVEDKDNSVTTEVTETLLVWHTNE